MFVEQLEDWFARLETRFADSPLAGEEWLQLGLQDLRGQKAALLVAAEEPAYNRLCAEAERLLQRLQACEGPTEVGWLNEPLRNARAYLAGSEALGCGEQFEAAYQRLKSLEVSQHLQDLGHDLMLWSQGHRPLGPRDLGVKLDEFVAAAVAEQELILADAWTLERLLTAYFRSPGEEIWQLWEGHLEAMEAEVLKLAENSVDVQQLLLEIESLRQCPAEQEELWEQLQRVRQEWSTVSQMLSLEAVRQADGREQPRLQNLDRLECLAQEFQQGTLELDDFQYEVGLHSQRLTGAMPHFWKLWPGDGARLAMLAELQKALQGLAQVTRPGDPQLGLLTQSYCHLLRELQSKA